MMIPPALCMVIVGPVTGQLSDRFGWRPFTFSRLALSAIAWFILATRLSETSSVTLVIAMLMLQSTGTALFNSPNNSSTMSAVERSSYGVMSSLTQLVRNSANVISVAVATAVIVFTMGSRGRGQFGRRFSGGCRGIRHRAKQGVLDDGRPAGDWHDNCPGSGRAPPGCAGGGSWHRIPWGRIKHNYWG